MATRSAKVLYDYDAEDDNQLSIKVGEIITLVGEATPENWILARNKKGNEGYIPDQYFEVMKGARPTGGPPVPPGKGGAGTGNTGGGSSAAVGEQQPSWAKPVDKKRGREDSSTVLEKHDSFNLFAYQMEWSTIAICFVVSIFTFFYGTVEPEGDYRCVVIGLICMIWVFGMTWHIGFQREWLFFGVFPHSALLRGVSFFIIMAMFCGGYPMGLYGILPCLLAIIVEVYVFHWQCKPIPTSLAEEWHRHVFGSCSDTCSSGRLIAFFVLFAVDIVCIGWGFVDGYNRAERLTDSFNDYDIRPVTFGMATGFARVISFNMVFLLIWMCHGCFTRRAKRAVAQRQQATTCGKCCTFMADADRRIFAHRILSYNIIWAGFLHVVSSYYAYELSGQTRSYVDAFGYETLVTGGFLFAFIGVLAASGNETLQKQWPFVFKMSHHIPGILFAILLFWHGPGGINRFYWMFGVVPTVFYAFDLLLRALAGDL